MAVLTLVPVNLRGLSRCHGDVYKRQTLVDIIKSEITKGAYKIAAAMLVKPFRNVKKYFDADEVGGAPFRCV